MLKTMETNDKSLAEAKAIELEPKMLNQVTWFKTPLQLSSDNTHYLQFLNKREFHGLCDEYYNNAPMRRKVLPYFFGNCKLQQKENLNITLILQMDVDSGYFEKVKTTVTNWNGPISLALYFRGGLKSNDWYMSRLKLIALKYNIQMTDICVHIVFYDEVSFFVFFFFKGNRVLCQL